MPPNLMFDTVDTSSTLDDLSCRKRDSYGLLVSVFPSEVSLAKSIPKDRQQYWRSDVSEAAQSKRGSLISATSSGCQDHSRPESRASQTSGQISSGSAYSDALHKSRRFHAGLPAHPKVFLQREESVATSRRGATVTEIDERLNLARSGLPSHRYPLPISVPLSISSDHPRMFLDKHNNVVGLPPAPKLQYSGQSDERSRRPEPFGRPRTYSEVEDQSGWDSTYPQNSYQVDEDDEEGMPSDSNVDQGRWRQVPCFENLHLDKNLRDFACIAGSASDPTAIAFVGHAETTGRLWQRRKQMRDTRGGASEHYSHQADEVSGKEGPI